MNVWELFPKMTELVRIDHESRYCAHHPFEHTLMVAQYCPIIADDDNVARLAALAGLWHNTDRLLPSPAEEAVVRNYILVNYHLRAAQSGDQAVYGLEPEEVNLVLDAVINHGKKNDPTDSPVLVCLKDADRLANINPFNVIARSGRAYPNLPLVDPRFIESMDPESTYRDPKTVFRDAIHSTLEWETWLRLPKAKKIAKAYFDGLRIVKDLTMRQYGETGLDRMLQ